MSRLTEKQERFCLAYIETGNASEAYRRAYDAGKMAESTVWRKAKDVLDNGKVAARIQELRAPVVKAAQLTVYDLLAELEKARIEAMTGDRPSLSAAVAATMGKAKLLGFGVDRVRNEGGVSIELVTGIPK